MNRPAEIEFATPGTIWTSPERFSRCALVLHRENDNLTGGKHF
jgi:hypothetical protein